MARRFSNLRSNMVRAGRKTFWLSGTAGSTAVAGASTAVITTSLNAAALALRPFTIVRTRGYFSIVTDQASASENQFGHFGAIVVSDQAVTVGVTAVPTPATDSQSSWYVYEATADRFFFHTSAAQNIHTVRMTEIDSKAMRKVEEGQDIITVVESAAVSDGFLAFDFTRTLIKLH